MILNLMEFYRECHLREDVKMVALGIHFLYIHNTLLLTLEDRCNFMNTSHVRNC